MKNLCPSTSTRPLASLRGCGALAASVLLLTAPACEGEVEDLAGDEYVYLGTEGADSCERDGGDCNSDHGDDPDPDQDQNPNEYQLNLSCDFSQIAGVWTSIRGSGIDYDQTVVFGPEADADEIIGYSVLYTNTTRLCAMDLRCEPTSEAGAFVVHASLADEENRWDCADAYYRVTRADNGIFHMTQSWDRAGEDVFAWADFNETTWGAPE